MTPAAHSIRAFIEPLVLDWPMQYGHWRDPGLEKRSSLLRPAGGAAPELLRRPQFTLTLVGRNNQDAEATAAAAEAVVAACTASSGDLVYLAAGEPSYFPTADGRPTFEIALSAIGNLTN
jgi:hypothetical protein